MGESSFRYICYHCMHRTDQEFEVCPECGRKKEDGQQPEEALLAETILGGRYLLGETLGIGGFGITYLGLDLEENCLVAVKEYFPSGLVKRRDAGNGDYRVTVTGEEYRRIFQNGVREYLEEGKNLARLREIPNIVSVKAYFTENETAYLVLDYIEGETLTAFLKKREAPMEAAEAVRLLLPALEAMAGMHVCGLIHRDISPDNIMINAKDQKATLIDFGAARDYRKGEGKTCIMVKPGYAPPEQYEKEAAQGPWTDIYGFCATLYRMITREIPMESIRREKGEPLRWPSEMGIPIDPGLERILKGGMALSCRERCQSAEILCLQLSEWMLAQDREADGGQEDMGAVPEPREKVGIAESGDENGEKICETQRGFWAHADTFLWILIATALVSGICVLGLLLGL